jgi:hypothetical protein
MANRPTTKTLAYNEWLKLVNKAKSGWRAFFIMRDEVDELNDYIHQFRHRNRVFRQNLENINNPELEMENIDITYLIKQFIEMYDKLKEFSECPVCYQTLTKDNIEVPKCGHLICKQCVERIKETATPVCPSCRKKY